MNTDTSYADLHLHTVFSDGTWTPRELILKSRKAGLSAIAIVDHDSVKGIASAIEIAKTQNIEVLPGIELSAEYGQLEAHILGYLIDYKNRKLTQTLEILRKNRIERIYTIVDKLNDAGISLNPESVFRAANQGTVGRSHIARALVAEGKVASVFEAFQKYIGNSAPCFVLGFKFSHNEAIKLIKDIGGVPILAHPYSLNNDELIARFIADGLMGLEVYYPQHSQSMINFYLGLAKKHNLLVTGGSDCHGDVKSDIRIGSIKLPYELVQRLKEAKDRYL